MTKASAPGKAILLGEHAVVYDQPAIAVPIPGIAAQVEINELLPPKPDAIHIEALDLRFSQWFRDRDSSDPLIAAVRLTLDAIGNPHHMGLRIRIHSSIPIASGLGSGAAVSVAIIRALSMHLGYPLPLEAQSALAFEVEKLHHGTPSGIDNTVVAFAQPVFFKRGSAPMPFKVGAVLPLVIADTGIQTATAAAVGLVRQGRQSDPGRFQVLFDHIGRLVLQARDAIESGEISRLGCLMNSNQSLLTRLGVSSPELDALIDAARESGALGAKLSGGGLGGNMIALTNLEAQPGVADALQTAGAKHVFCIQVGS